MDSNTAALIIQTHYRGHLAKKIYCKKLLEKFQKDEFQRHEKEQLQVTEGELLVKRYHLRMEIADIETVASNKQRHMNAMATRIQREWRAYKARCLRQRTYQQTRSAMAITSAETSPDSTADAVLNDAALVSDTDQQSQLNQLCDFSDSSSIMDAIPVKLALSSRPHGGYENNTETHSSTRSRLGVKQPLSFENKYRLCFTSDLSESSGEEQELMVTSTPLTDQDEKFEEYHRLSAGEAVGVINEDTGTQIKRDSFFDIRDQLENFLVTTDDLLFSEEFEEDGCTTNEAPSEMDSLSDSLTLKGDISPPSWCSTNSSSPKKTVSDGSSTTQVHAQHYLDHSTSPLHLMTVHELRTLLKLLTAKIDAASKELIKLLIQRDELIVENNLLHKNIAKLARNTQNLYNN